MVSEDNLSIKAKYNFPTKLLRKSFGVLTSPLAGETRRVSDREEDEKEAAYIYVCWSRDTELRIIQSKGYSWTHNGTSGQRQRLGDSMTSAMAAVSYEME